MFNPPHLSSPVSVADLQELADEVDRLLLSGAVRLVTVSDMGECEVCPNDEDNRPADATATLATRRRGGSGRVDREHVCTGCLGTRVRDTARLPYEMWVEVPVLAAAGALLRATGQS